jgi:predicted DCC family thiol-disulfide oxidoreductase YuxK
VFAVTPVGQKIWGKPGLPQEELMSTAAINFSLRLHLHSKSQPRMIRPMNHSTFQIHQSCGWPMMNPLTTLHYSHLRCNRHRMIRERQNWLPKNRNSHFRKNGNFPKNASFLLIHPM